MIRPALVRAAIKPRSKSMMPVNTVSNELPSGVVVSAQGSASERKPASACLIRTAIESVGLSLIGMRGIQMRLSRYSQLYSRVGFAQAYRPLQDEELTFVLTRRWRQLGLNLDDADSTNAQAVATIVRNTGGNFRLVHRLFVQIERILRINRLNVISDDVVEAARSVLVMGAT